ncbi:neuropeptide SIFamide receptor-like [Octopus vulgaris]|uniref:Neuropeptide SIFamide receptor-like n=1 Tax=Octopus vulgaris TaxID=6645 RepID=A0AA36EYX4_OCTVU|nr:neuropeptide SIFamide receptor-like [Octopus vulgaris]
MHTVTNYFLVNLAVADILVAVFCLPMTLLDNLFSGWPFGAILCKATPYLQGVSVCASVNTLAAIAIDRYLAICYTLQFKISSTVSRVIIVSTWIFALLVMIPWAVFYRQIPHRNYKFFSLKKKPPICGKYHSLINNLQHKYYTFCEDKFSS